MKLVKALIWTLLLSGLAVMLLGSLRGGPLKENVLTPPLQAPDLQGKMHSLASMRGKPVVLYFWATWCNACKLTSPTVDRYAADHPEVQVLGIAMDEKEAVRAYTLENTRSYPIVPMTEPISRAWPVRSLPTTMILDTAGRLVWQRVGVLLPFELEMHAP